MSQPQALTAMPAQGGLNSAANAMILDPSDLSVADNIRYGLHGERRKRLGTARYNGTAIAAGANIVALADFWRFGASLTPTQRYLVAANARLYSSTPADVGAGTWTDLGAFGSNTSLITNITIAQGYAVISDGSSTPQKWDQTTLTALDAGAGTAPLFTACTYHLARLFEIGYATQPSQVTVTAGGDIVTHSGADALTFQLDQDDSDACIGISRPFHKRLYIFKGPNVGSIHEISGNTLSTLQHDRIFEGLPLHNHKALITTPNDIFWISHMGVHSLLTTQTYGDTTSAFLSKPIQNLFESGIDQTRLSQAVGFWNPLYGIVGWFFPPTGYTTNSQAMVYHYLISDPNPDGKKYWSLWRFSGSVAGYSAATMLTVSTAASGAHLPRLFVGGSADGFVYSGDQETLTDGNGSAYSARAKTGINLTLGQAGPLQEKSFHSVTTFYEPVGTYDHTLTVTVDNRSVTKTIQMAGVGDPLG